MSRPVASLLNRASWGNVAFCTALGVMLLGLLALQAGAWEWRNPGAARWSMAIVVLLAWSGFTVWMGRRRRAVSQPVTGAVMESQILVVFASQTGTAEQLGRQTVQSLQQAGMRAGLIGLGNLDAEVLAQTQRALFVVSTTGEGDAPDSAARFVTGLMRDSLPLAHLRYGMLALGDSDYESFCGFGRDLQHWLQISGAMPLFDAVYVDNGDAAALRHWQHHLARLSGAVELPDWERPVYQRWQLIDRRQLNPGSLGGPCFHLALRPMDGEATWRAGDLVEIGPKHATDTVERWLAQPQYDGDLLVEHDGRRAPLREWLAGSHLPSHKEVRGRTALELVASLRPLPHREYSIASLPSDGALHLLVRQMQREDGTPGIGSGWLALHAEKGAEIALRIRSNPGFHAPEDARPLILIGNGTGLAGLRALLKARIEAGYVRNWLLFGERQVERDFYHREEIVQWLECGSLGRLDLAWSRDGAARTYVQDRLRVAAEELQQWVDAGASIYVCGSLDGMAPGVDAVLRDVLGNAMVEQLREEGRYRRDVY